MRTHKNTKRFRRYKVLKSKVHTRQIEKERLRNFILIAIFGIIIVLFLFGRKGLIRLIQLEFERVKLKSEITEFTKNNLIMKEEIEKLQKDPKTIEKIAREELGLVKKGEVIYKFVPKVKDNSNIENQSNK